MDVVLYESVLKPYTRDRAWESETERIGKNKTERKIIVTQCHTYTHTHLHKRIRIEFKTCAVLGTNDYDIANTES